MKKKLSAKDEGVGIKTWNVRVVRDGRAIHIGQVDEDTEALARCAALSRFGLSEQEVEADGAGVRRAAIYPDEDFEVSTAGMGFGRRPQWFVDAPTGGKTEVDLRA